MQSLELYPENAQLKKIIVPEKVNLINNHLKIFKIRIIFSTFFLFNDFTDNDFIHLRYDKWSVNTLALLQLLRLGVAGARERERERERSG